ncbi:MAG: 9-O-acetylesterase, partial [Acidobacteriota bacterium]
MKILILTLVILICSLASLGDVRLPDVIGSSMILQQKQKLPVWGWAEPGETVTVEFAGQKKTTAAGPDGKWRVELSGLKANSNPQSMIIAGKNRIELTDILVGEVWLVAGQSNMQRLLRETANGDAVQAAANHPDIRLFNV